MRSLLELSGEVRSHLTLAHSVVGFLGGLGGSCLLVSLTAQFSWTISSFDEEERPSIAGPGLSATYYLVWKGIECWWPLGVHLMAVSRAPNCWMFDPLHAISVVSQGWSLVGLPFLVINLGNNLAKMLSGITLPLAPVLTLHLRLPHWFGPISRHGDSCSSFGECTNVDCSDADVFWITRGWVGHVDRGSYCPATQSDNSLGLAWLSLGFWPSQAEWCGSTPIVIVQTSLHCWS